jgi:hypothetical protein
MADRTCSRIDTLPLKSLRRLRSHQSRTCGYIELFHGCDLAFEFAIGASRGIPLSGRRRSLEPVGRLLDLDQARAAVAS